MNKKERQWIDITAPKCKVCGGVLSLIHQKNGLTIHPDCEPKGGVMPEELQNFLLDLSTTNADEVWKWLDANPHAVDEMVAVLLDSHPDLE